jgi:hypothetical protein
LIGKAFVFVENGIPVVTISVERRSRSSNLNGRRCSFEYWQRIHSAYPKRGVNNRIHFAMVFKSEQVVHRYIDSAKIDAALNVEEGRFRSTR